jgi:hypothetical protein
MIRYRPARVLFREKAVVKAALSPHMLSHAILYVSP